ncbi:hypothetical protein DL770_002929 [Monosporascus sp. CRB-9-2]|nr:hypothetical protein DL770_002929 [Monosporascus sp. CRB-9-2]
MNGADDAVALTERLGDLAADLHDADVVAPAADTGLGISEVDVLLAGGADGGCRDPDEDVLVAEHGNAVLRLEKDDGISAEQEVPEAKQ